MSEHDETGTRLAAALHAEADRTTPEPGLQRILARTQSAPRRSRSTRWWPALAGAVAACALVAVAVVVFGGGRTSEPLVVGGGAQREVTVYFTNADDKLVPEQVTVPDTGDPGLDTVTALIYNQPRDNDYLNEWHALSVDANDSATAGAQVLSVQAVDGVITVDLDSHVPEGMATVDCGKPGACHVPNGRVVVQQLVYTLHANLHTDAPVVVTDRGDPMTAMFGSKVGGPTAAVQPSQALAMIQIESPTQGKAVTSPITVSGQSATFEGNVVWRVKQNGKVVDHGFVQSQGANANGVFGPFEFTIDLPPGDYTVEAYEESAENGDIINLDSKDFTVE